MNNSLKHNCIFEAMSEGDKALTHVFIYHCLSIYTNILQELECQSNFGKFNNPCFYHKCLINENGVNKNI